MTDSSENEAYEEAYKCRTVYSHHKRKQKEERKLIVWRNRNIYKLGKIQQLYDSRSREGRQLWRVREKILTEKCIKMLSL